MGKRWFDLVVGTVLALVAVPLVLVLAVGVALSLRTWPFFVQDRVGRHGRTFKFLKLRTLPRSAPRYTDKYSLGAHQPPRFTAALRRSHLDELPQLLLVPLGRMSLVGPRPEMPHLVDAGDPSFARRRLAAAPGCAGLWQASAAAEGLIWDSPEYDLFYLEHANLRLDAWVLWRTAMLMLSLGSRIELRDVPPWALRPEAYALPRRTVATSGAAVPLP